MSIFNINIDGFIGLIVSIITIYSSIKMIKEVLAPIIGLMPSEKQVNEIRDKLFMEESISNSIFVAYTKANKKIEIKYKIKKEVKDILLIN